MEFIFNSYDNSKQSISYCEVDKCKIVIKLKKCLQEIKEIAEQEIVCDDCNLQGTNKCDSRLCTSFYLDDFCKSLLQKISEVVDEI